VKYAWIEEQKGSYPVRVLCKVLGGSRSSFYDWRERPLSERAQRREVIKAAVAESYEESERVYGHRKIHRDVVAMGYVCCKETVRRVMLELELRAQKKKKFVVTTDSDHADPVAPNLLARDFTATEPNQKWVADITYLATDEGWLYLATVMDLFNRQIVGWATSENIDAALVIEALANAVVQQKPEASLLLHSDRGAQYTAEQNQRAMEKHGIVCSMSRRGNCWDNACMERFFGSLKTEWTNHRRYRTRAEATQDVFEYIEIFYNRKRRHATLGYLSPLDFAKQHEARAA